MSYSFNPENNEFVPKYDDQVHQYVKSQEVDRSWTTSSGRLVLAKKHGQLWTEEDERILRFKFGRNHSIEEIAVRLGRLPSAITARLEKLGLLTWDQFDGEYKPVTHSESSLKEKSNMECNIAALLREDARTVQVVFVPYSATPFEKIGGIDGDKRYTYVTNEDLKAGDWVLVIAAGDLKVARVAQVDSEVKIEPQSKTQYGWIISKVDFTAYEENVRRNKEIELAVSAAYRSNLRRSFQQQILSGLEGPALETVSKLIGKS